MARVRRNQIVQGLSGKLGDQIMFRHLQDGRTIVCRVPDFSNRVLSRDQKAHHTKFKAGAAYAKEAAKPQPIYAQLAAGTMKTAYNVALADFFHPPVIHSLERINASLKIRASDDVMVVRVFVTVFDADGKSLEKGEATQMDADLWIFPLQHDGRVLVDVYDLAGNVAKGELD